MPRLPRIVVPNQIYHIINRANAKAQIFQSTQDYLLFENTLIQAIRKFNISLFCHSIMPNHIHLALLVKNESDLSKFMHWLTMNFTQRYHHVHQTTGCGHLFQSRYKSFIIRDEKYLLQLFLYIERNALKAGLVGRAEYWRWSSLWIREYGTKNQKEILTDWPIERSVDYLEFINNPIEISRENIGLIDRKAGRPKKEVKMHLSLLSTSP